MINPVSNFQTFLGCQIICMNKKLNKTRKLKICNTKKRHNVLKTVPRLYIYIKLLDYFVFMIIFKTPVL